MKGQQGYFNSNPLFPEMPMSEEDPQHYSSTTSFSPTTTEEETAMLSYSSSQGSFYMQPGTTPGSNHQMQANYINEYSYYPQHGYSSGSDSHSSLMYASSPVNESPFVHTSHTYTAVNKANSATPSPTSSMSSSKSLTTYTSVTTAPGNMYLHPTQEFTGYELNYPQRQEYSEGSSNFDNNSGGGDRKFFRNSSPVSNETRSSATMSNNISHSNHGRPKHSNSNKKNPYSKGQGREKTKKRCSNCHSVHSPSWRRSIDKKTKGALLCNACGLYEKTAKKKRMLVTQEDGNTKVVRKREARDYSCSICGIKDVTRWRRAYDSVQCERCARGRTSSSNNRA